MINFGEETRKVLTNYGYTIDDIDWIGNDRILVSKESFFKQADRFNYDSGFGTAHAPTDIIIFMKDNTWFERKEYDGLEWWIYRSTPKRPSYTYPYQLTEFDPNAFWPKLHDFAI